MNAIIYTAGYGAGWSIETLRQALEKTGAALVDIRQAPWSRSPQWQKQTLAAAFGDRYAHVPALGNLNYRGGPIRLANPDLGAAQVGRLLERWPAVLLLCGCKDVEHCHRKIAAERCAVSLAERWQIEVVHLTPEKPQAAMKCLSLRQPWAWAVIHGGKDIENRHWATHYRGPILIDAAHGMTHAEYDEASAFIAKASDATPPPFESLPRGGIIGAVRIVDCVEQSASPWFMGPHGFILADAQPLPFLPLSGQLGIFDVPESTLQPIADAIAALKWSGTP